MAEKTVTRLDLAEALRRNCGVSKEVSSKLVEDVLECITNGLVEDGEVKLSSFATFTVTSKSPRVGRNPKTGEEQSIAARKVVRFRASHRMRSRLEDLGK